MIDIFIPMSPGHAHKVNSAIQSALTQSYKDLKVIVYVDGVIRTEQFDSLVSDPRVTYVLDDTGPHGNAYYARRWYFDEYSEKFPFMNYSRSESPEKD